MHVTKQVSTILRAYDIGGTWLSIDTYLDKRPYFFPFLVSLMHDFTGYRIANMFALNVACAAALLALLYWFARELAGRGPALLAVALMATMPLFGQNATGASMDLHNLAMLALVACLALIYLRSPSDDRLSLLVLGAVLLSESRYESVVFVFPTAAVIAVGWYRAGRVYLPWPAVIAPLLLVPWVWHHRVLEAEPVFWQLKEGQTSAFGLENVADNLRGDVDFLFNTGPGLANSFFLSAIGVAGLAWLLFEAWRRARLRPRPPLPAATVVALAFGAGVAGHFIVLLFYWWAKFNDLMASRFALPMCLAFSVLAAALVRALAARRMPALRIAWAGLGIWLLACGMTAINVKFYTNENLGMQELDWERSVITSRPGPILVISNKSTIPFILWHIECILNNIAVQKGEDIRYHMGQGTFKEVIVTQAIRPTTANGEMGVDPEDLMPPSFHLQKIAEKRFGGRLDRMSRIVSIDPEPEKPRKSDQRPSAPSPLRTISALQSLSDPAVAALTSSSLRR
jgi:4-amino-4-deoxy-L-arabinose transferase-like glycosyltransferase